MKIALVGEAYGAEEAQWSRPFIGPAGQELNRMLADAGVLREECYVSNVFNFRPDNNDISSLCIKKGEVPRDYKWPALVRGLYLKPEYLSEVDRLRSELTTIAPNIVVALGKTAAWSLVGDTMIKKLRGTVMESSLIPGLKVLLTWHPDDIRKQYELRHVSVMDLMKAKVESEFPEIRRPSREIWLSPNLADIRTFMDRHIRASASCAFDIETASGQITCIGFAPDVCHALVIPFSDMRAPTRSYWESPGNELEAWRLVKEILNLPIAFVAQNGLYDIQYLWMKYGIAVPGFAEDTMLLHHALQPESPKGLDFLGSVYTNELAWKTHRPRGKTTIKRED